LGILLGTLMVAVLGLIDDIKGINAAVQMVGIVVAALIPVAAFGMTWENVGLPLFGNFDLGWAAYPLTVLWIAALANLVNLIDGMDSLASGIVASAAGSFALLAGSIQRADAAAYALLLRFEPPRPLGHWQLDNTLIALGVGVVVLAASVWMVYTLEILKSRHLQLLRRGKLAQEPEREEAVERALSAGGRR